jgi:UDPglucose 6-dehydrogenase
MKDGAILIVSSQSPVGFCRILRAALKEKKRSLELVYSPENLRLGEAIECYLNPGRIILGVPDSATEEKCRELFSQVDAEILSMNLESAEMVKHGINSFLATSIVFSNQLADICEVTGARIDDVAAGMKTDPRIGPKAYLSPGIGFSGGTLGRDLKVLEQKNIEAHGDAELFGKVHGFNQRRRESIIKKIERILGHLEGRQIGILGLTYKPGTSTLRRSLPVEIANLLAEKGASVTAYDPQADFGELNSKPQFTRALNIEEVSRLSDALVLLTEWKEFRDYDWKPIPRQMKQSVFFDTKNFLNEKEMSSYGFKYYSIGS